MEEIYKSTWTLAFVEECKVLRRSTVEYRMKESALYADQMAFEAVMMWKRDTMARALEKAAGA